MNWSYSPGSFPGPKRGNETRSLGRETAFQADITRIAITPNTALIFRVTDADGALILPLAKAEANRDKCQFAGDIYKFTEGTTTQIAILLQDVKPSTKIEPTPTGIVYEPNMDASFAVMDVGTFGSISMPTLAGSYVTGQRLYYDTAQGYLVSAPGLIGGTTAGQFIAVLPEDAPQVAGGSFTVANNGDRVSVKGFDTYARIGTTA